MELATKHYLSLNKSLLSIEIWLSIFINHWFEEHKIMMWYYCSAINIVFCLILFILAMYKTWNIKENEL